MYAFYRINRFFQSSYGRNLNPAYNSFNMVCLTMGTWKVKRLNPTRIAHDFSNIVREIRKRHTGKGPEEIITRFAGPWAICEMKGNMTNLEKFMSQTDDGKRMIHATRTEFIKKIYEDKELVERLESIVNAKFVAIFNDFNVDLDTAITVYVFDQDLEFDRSNK